MLVDVPRPPCGHPNFSFGLSQDLPWVVPKRYYMGIPIPPLGHPKLPTLGVSQLLLWHPKLLLEVSPKHYLCGHPKPPLGHPKLPALDSQLITVGSKLLRWMSQDLPYSYVDIPNSFWSPNQRGTPLLGDGKKNRPSHREVLITSLSINRRIQDLRKKYNEVNNKLGQTGAGMSYEDLVADPTKSNIIQKLVDSFPWWPDLHGWWRKNPAYNNSSAGFIADSGQNLETETLLTFKRGGEGSKRRGAEGEVEGEGGEDDEDDAEDNGEADGDGGEIPSGDTSLCEGPAAESRPWSSGLNSLNRHDDMDVDQDDLYHATSLRQPPPQSVTSRGSPAPLSFRGGAPCIVPKRPHPTDPRSNNNVISLNSDDESDRMPRKRPIITATLQPRNPPPAVDISDSDSSIMFGHARRSPSSRQTPTEDSDSSSRLSPITGLTSQAGTTSQAAGTSLSGSQSRKRPRETPADKLANRFTDTSEALVKQLQETRLARLEGKRQKREHEKWVREQDAAEADRERDLKRSLAEQRTEQLKLELELERSRERQLALGGKVPNSMDV
ncbi:hypothetical protein BU15DRAFT_65925 [Melanogaster broomeanus]|nr:hypothetical protein BU15DRAFT_65925 [Melanogaster broomeanus]